MRYKLNEEQLREIQAARKRNKNKNAEKRLSALELRAKGVKDSEIASKLGYNPKYISHLVKKYLTKGIDVMLGAKREANRRNLSYAEESKFLESFKDKASAGQIVTAKEIRAAYEEKIGHACGSGQVYRLLKRHNWRKIKPRSQHSKKASNEAIEASKKLTIGWQS